MDIVQRIGQYFAQHEQQMNDVMKQALERSQSLVPAAPPVKPPRVIQGAFFSSRQPSTTTKPSSPSSLYQSEDVPDPPSPVTAVRKPPPSRLKPKRKNSSKKKPIRPTPTTTPEKEASTITKLTTAQKLQEAWRLTCERAKKIQTDQEAKLKETQELERHEKARRDSQLQQIESARRQAFAKPRPPSPTVPPKQLNVAEIWCEPRRAERKPRPQRPTVALRPAKPSKIPDESCRLAQPHSQSSDPISSNNVPAGPLLHAHLNPVTKFGPPPSSTPYLDELEARKRAMLLEQGTAVSKVREQLEQQRLAAKRQAEKDSMCRRREAHNAALATTVAQLQVEKEHLEQSLRSLQVRVARFVQRYSSVITNKTSPYCCRPRKRT
ncbi:hypothetical protein, variant [Aphanomyces invadans]|uniref:Uncharacterized protein n=1 Tax=Aphanomyces invadans TaxID=157072 RepID=A0A024TT55_9STRA|nr:hypothetical protein, variant [Aphanomyces invadans]ETV96482.1 hypothetical protein, variant [Aphanomyces invadans]|eukprot:XP_008874745.1 hypothetical protein, variant [Aphanomyces invadans]